MLLICRGLVIFLCNGDLAVDRHQVHAIFDQALVIAHNATHIGQIIGTTCGIHIHRAGHPQVADLSLRAHIAKQTRCAVGALGDGQAGNGGAVAIKSAGKGCVGSADGGPLHALQVQIAAQHIMAVQIIAHLVQLLSGGDEGIVLKPALIRLRGINTLLIQLDILRRHLRIVIAFQFLSERSIFLAHQKLPNRDKRQRVIDQNLRVFIHGRLPVRECNCTISHIPYADIRSAGAASICDPEIRIACRRRIFLALRESAITGNKRNLNIGFIIGCALTGFRQILCAVHHVHFAAGNITGDNVCTVLFKNNFGREFRICNIQNKILTQHILVPQPLDIAGCGQIHIVFVPHCQALINGILMLLCFRPFPFARRADLAFRAHEKRLKFQQTTDIQTERELHIHGLFLHIGRHICDVQIATHIVTQASIQRRHAIQLFFCDIQPKNTFI